MIRVGIIGYGYWGPNLVRNFHESERASVVGLSDLREDRLRHAAKRYPDLHTTTDFQDLLRHGALDVVAIATPVRSHYELALASLRAGKHVLLEKPMTETSDQAKHLIDEAADRNLTLMVDHTFVYTGAVRKIREIHRADELGSVYYYDSSRINLGLFQHDVDVVWDLAVHDFAILDFVLDDRPVSISASGVAHIAGAPENLAYVTVFFDSGAVAHINVNWLAPVKLRRTLIGGSKKMIIYDDLEPSEKIKVYDKGITITDDPNQIYQMRVGYRVGDMWAPQLDRTEALQVEVNHFLDCVEGRARPITDGAMGLRIVCLLEAATRSMRRQGQPMDLTAEGLQQ